MARSQGPTRRSVLATAAAMIIASRAARALPKALSVRRLKLLNAHTGETFEGAYRNDTGPITPVMDELSSFLRDHHSGQKIPIDVGVIDFLFDVMDSVGASQAIILSAYRTPETNAMLARTTFGVAEHSQHVYGRALDVHLPTRLEDAMLIARQMKRGGVGWYPLSGFFHIDTGPVRHWALTQRGLDLLLLEGHDNQQFREAAAPSAPTLVQRSKSASPNRLSMHRLLAQAEQLAITRSK